MSRLQERQILFVMDDINTIKPAKDTTFALMLEATRLGAQIFYCEQAQLFYRDDSVQALATEITVRDQATAYYAVVAQKELILSDLDWIFMRQDPPVDERYINTTFLLDKASQQGARIINEPRAVRDCNEKISISWFPEFIPPTLIAADKTVLHQFIQEQNDVIVKPLNGMGGTGIFRIQKQDPNLHAILETLTHFGTTAIMAQRYLPEVEQGDKRIFIIDGEVFPYALLRIPKTQEVRANLAKGGRGVGATVTSREQEIAARVGPVLNDKGLFMIGMDVIGGYLTEINVTSPTCAREIEDHFGESVCRHVFAKLMQRTS